MDLDAHFFRRESARMLAALTRVFGVHQLALAEDVVQDALVRAVELWGTRGVPENPSAWLMATAKHRALDVLRRGRTARALAPELGRSLESEGAAGAVIDEAFAARAIHEEQLRMMFSCCHPRLPEEAQLALILNILCGFGAEEIARAFLAGRAAVEKRIARGKKALAGPRRLFELTDAGFAARLGTVQRALYLLFNEGYHGASDEEPVRAELCEEALRLTLLLREHPAAATPSTDALAALMSLHAARLPARRDAGGELSSLADQDRARWDPALTAQGLSLLQQASRGDTLDAYHVEAALAAAHASARSVEETDWTLIVSLYDRLMALGPSPIVALNRAIAIGQRDGPEAGLEAIRAIADRKRLERYPFLPAAIAELELRRGDYAAARRQFEAARANARSDPERRFLEKRLRLCDAARASSSLASGGPPLASADRSVSAPCDRAASRSATPRAR